MKSKDILNRLNDEVEHVMPNASLSNITSTPIKVNGNGGSAGTATATMTNTSFVRTRAFKIICAITLVIALIVGIVVPVVMMTKSNGLSPVSGDFVGSTYLTMDINPSVDFVVDNKSIVRNVMSKNNDGDVLLYDGFKESLIGKHIDEAVTMTIAQATRLGYIDASVPTSGKASAVRISVAGDDVTKANAVLKSAKDSAIDHLKSSGIYMVVVDKVLPKDSILSGSGIASIDSFNESSTTKESYHYISTVSGKTDKEIAESFKTDFISHYLAESFEEIFEDIDDVMDIIADIDELDDDIASAEREDGTIIMHDYWYYREAIMNGEEVKEHTRDVVENITAKIEEYNERILEHDDDSLDLSTIFSSVTTEANYKKIKVLNFAYIKSNGKEKIDRLIDELEENVDKLDLLLIAINEVFDKVFDGFSAITDRVKTEVNARIDKVMSEADEYYNVCKEEIKKTHDALAKKHENNVGAGAITDEEYERFVESALDGYDDLDDFWTDTHR